MCRFTKDLLQSVSDWQRGGSEKQKQKRAAALKKEAAGLEEKFRECDQVCYRQIALEKGYVWALGTDFHLKESVSSWTTSVSLAKEFKGGVPPVGYQGIVFAINPQKIGRVIVNIKRVMADPEFRVAEKRWAKDIVGYSNGMGRYGDSQHEVVIECSSVPLGSVHAWGGYTSPETKLAKLVIGHSPSRRELQEFRKLMELAGHEIGPYWLETPEAVKRISEKLLMHARNLAPIKEAQARAVESEGI